MRETLLDLLHDNPLPLPEIIAHLRRVGIPEAHKAGEVLREMARESPPWVGEVGGVWDRVNVPVVEKQVSKQKELFA